VRKISAIPLLLCCLAVSPIYGQTGKTRAEVIAFLNYVATEASLVKENQSNSLVLEDIYNRLENYVEPGLLDDSDRLEFDMRFNQITDFKKTDIRRQRIRYLYDRAKSRAVLQSIPSPIFFLSLAGNIRDPLALVVNIVGMAGSAFTSYLNAAEQAELQFYEESSRLDEEKLDNVNSLRSGFFNYMSRTASANGLRGTDTVAPDDIERFRGFIKEENLSMKIENLERNRSIYEKYFPYWLELANTYYRTGKYGECITAIERYEAIRAPIFRPNRDVDYAQALTNGVLALGSVYKNNPREYARQAGVYLQKIEDNSPDFNWPLRYFAALAYMDIASLSAGAERTDCLNRAYRLLRGNVTLLAADQRKQFADYQSPFNPPKTNDKKLAEANKKIKEGRERELPPVNESFVLNYTALHGVMTQLGVSSQTRSEIRSIVEDSVKMPGLRRAFLADNGGFPAEYSPVKKTAYSLSSKTNTIGTIIGTAVGIPVGSVGLGFVAGFVAGLVTGPGALATGAIGAIAAGATAGGAVGGGILGNHLSGGDETKRTLQMSCPAVFLGVNSIVNVRVTDGAGAVLFDEKKVPWGVVKIDRKGGGLDKYTAEIKLLLSEKIETVINNKKHEYTANVAVSDGGYTATLHFQRPAGESNFTRYRVTFE
jgi:hypothetical protein